MQADFLFGAPWIGQKEIDSVCDVLRSGWIGQGRIVEDFERRLALYLQTPQEIVCVSSGTAALFLALRLAGLKPPARVLVPALTFVATANVAIELGLEVEFADVSPGDFNMVLPENPHPDIRAVMPVHFAGRPCDIFSIEGEARRRRWTIIEDAAHALGAKYWQGGGKVGCGRNLTCFSFYATKNVTCIEGGAISLPDVKEAPELVSRLRSERLHGLDKDAWRRNEVGGWGTASLMERYGYKLNLTDVQAAVGIVQLAKLDWANFRRGEIATRYQHEMAGLPLTLPLTMAEGVWHLFVVLAESGRVRAALQEHLCRCGVPTGIHYVPVHKHPYYYRRYPGVSCPTAEDLGNRCLSLPISPAMSDCQISQVVRGVREFFHG